MSEILYLGIAATDEPVTVFSQSAIHGLVRNMRMHRVEQISGVHKAPCIIRDETNDRIAHPVLGAQGVGYAGFAYVNRYLKIGAERIAHGRWSKGNKDELSVTLHMDAEAKPDSIGIPVHRPGDISAEDEVKVREVLDKSPGYAALRMELGGAQNDGTRRMVLVGQGKAGELEELPFSNVATSIIMGQVGVVLQKDLHQSLGL